MNGLFNMMPFVMTLALAKDVPESRDRVLMAMAGGQSKNLFGPVLLKVGAIDPIANLTQENTDLQTANKILKAELADCQAKLKACEDGTELKNCQAALTGCQADLAKCQAELNACKEERDACKRDLTARTAALTTCQTNLTTCQTDLTKCQGDLATCQGGHTVRSKT